MALGILYARWLTFHRSLQGKENWANVTHATSNDELMSEYAALAVFDNEDQQVSDAHEFAAVLRGLVQIIDAAIGVPPTSETPVLIQGAFDVTLDLLNHLGKQAGEFETPPGLAELMSAITVRPGDLVVDPVCGNGTGLLVAANSVAGVSALGCEINSRVARRANMRLAIHGVGDGKAIHCGDAMDPANSYKNSADVVVAQPPWGATYTEDQKHRIRELASLFSPNLTQPKFPKADMPWLLLAMDAINEFGRAALLLSSLSVSPSCRETHQQLLNLNAIEAVVSLPPRLFSHAGITTTLWLLRAPTESKESVPFLLVDAKAFIEVGDTGQPVMSSATRRNIESLVNSFRNEAKISAPAHAARIVDRDGIDLARGLHPKNYLAAAPVEEIWHPEPANSMLTEITLTNFKAFGSRTKIPLTPLTLIYGANSAGKSSIIQSLLLLKQSKHSKRMVSQGPIVNVGSFGGITHGHQSSSVGFSLSYGVISDWIPPEGTPYPALPRTASWVFEPNSAGHGTAVEASWRFGDYELKFTNRSDPSNGLAIDLTSAESVFLGVASGTLLYPFDSRHIRDGDEKQQTTRLRSREAHARRALKSLLSTGDGVLPVRSVCLLPAGDAILPNFHEGPDGREGGIVASYANRAARLGAGMSEEINRLLEATVWLGPLRSAPKRVYDRTDAVDTPGDGRHVAVYLFDHTTVVSQVNDWLRLLEIPYFLDVVQVTTGKSASFVGDLVSIALTDTRSGITVTPADVGFGISQVLPIVVELLARRESIIAIEQPETHLHPRLQARLADLFIDSVQKGGRGNQILAETHSEHLMLRVQRRIREGTLDPAIVSVVYVNQDSTGQATVKPLRLDENGEFIDEWPDGFFDDRLEELFGEF